MKSVSPNSVAFQRNRSITSVTSSPIETIIIMIVIFFILIGISFFIAKKLLKKDKKFTIVVALIIWTVIFAINFGLVSIDRAPILTFKWVSYWDGTPNGKYIGLGYKIDVKGYSLLKNAKETREVKFVSIFAE